MATDTGFDFANSKSPNRASNTGTVMMCWAIDRILLGDAGV